MTKKEEVRKSKEWKLLRKIVAEEQGNIDLITHKKLRKGYILHHLSQCADFYDDLDKKRFVALNHKSHDFVHFCYNYTIDINNEVVNKMYYFTWKDNERLNRTFFKVLKEHQFMNDVSIYLLQRDQLFFVVIEDENDIPINTYSSFARSYALTKYNKWKRILMEKKEVDE